MNRYSKIRGKNPREIVLLKSHPCQWGCCFFCDYISDNGTNEKELIEFNKEVLKNISGEFKQVEVINSASVFDLPKESLKNIKDMADKLAIETIYFESHYSYKDRLDEIRDYFKEQKIVFKCGIESFDHDFRNKFLRKGVYFEDYEEVLSYFPSICLMVGIKGQTREMVKKDMEIARNFERVCVNIYTENSSPVKRDESLIAWFKEEYAYLDKDPKFEILWNNTDFGVGD